MKITIEYRKIIKTEKDIIVNAVAGSGKTTTMLEYARARPDSSKILYLAFNKSVKMEAAGKFRKAGLKNVTVETAHSMAYRAIVKKWNYSIKTTGYKTHEIVSLLGIKSRQPFEEFILGNHILGMLSFYCNSREPYIEKLKYAETIADPKLKGFVKSINSFLVDSVKKLYGMMDRGEIEITHDFYLKKFQMGKPMLKYDYILFDEGQDASDVMLDILMCQKATKVIVGDVHQQIYSWRYAVNSLEKVSFPIFQLSNSFRFGQEIADLAMKVLDWKKLLGMKNQMKISGSNERKGPLKSRAVLARTNISLLLCAIDYLNLPQGPKDFYFEGNFNSYTYAEEGTSLYDVLYLFNGKRQRIRDQMIRQMGSIKDLEEYVEKTDDRQIGMLVDIVKKYKNDIPNLLKRLKSRQVPDSMKAHADIVFSTVHKCKGMEYDEVELLGDFITREKLMERLKESAENPMMKARINEEINLLYVAITRAKYKVHLPDGIFNAKEEEEVRLSVC